MDNFIFRLIHNIIKYFSCSICNFFYFDRNDVLNFFYFEFGIVEFLKIKFYLLSGFIGSYIFKFLIVRFKFLIVRFKFLIVRFIIFIIIYFRVQFYIYYDIDEFKR